MQGGVGEDGVELLVECERGDVAGFELQVRKVGARLGGHGGGAVDAEDAGAGGGDFGGEVAGAAADIEDALAGLGGELGEEGAAVFPDEGVGGIVEARVPIGH